MPAAKERLLEVLHGLSQKTTGSRGEYWHTISIIDDLGVDNHLNGNVRTPLDDYVAFDLETTGLSAEEHEIIEIALVRFKRGEPSEAWSSLVRPNGPVPLKVLRLTGIDAGELEEAPSLAEVLETLGRFRGHLPLVGHNSAFDAAFIAKHVPDFPNADLYDTLELGRIVFPGLKSYRLSEFAGNMGVILDGAHRAANDAEVSGKLFRLIQEGIDLIPEADCRRIIDIMGPAWTARSLFEPARHLDAGPMDLFQWAKGQEKKAEWVPVDQVRPFDLTPDLYDRVLHVLSKGQDKEQIFQVKCDFDSACTAACAAGQWSSSEGKKTLLIGFPEGVSGPGGRPYPEAVFPGNYLCRLRFEQAMNLASQGLYDGLDLEERRFLASVARWARLTQDGYFRELQMTGVSAGIARELACLSDSSCLKWCNYAAECFREKAVEKAKHEPVTWVSPYRLFNEEELSPAQYDRVLVWQFHEGSRWWQRAEPEINLARLQTFLNAADLNNEVPSLEALVKEAAAVMGRSDTPAGPTDKLVEKVGREIRERSRQMRTGIRAQGGSSGRGPAADPPILSRTLHELEEWDRVVHEYLGPYPQESVRVLWQGRAPDGTGIPVLSRRSIWPGKEALASIQRAYGGTSGIPAVLMSNVAVPISASRGALFSFGLHGLASAAPHGGLVHSTRELESVQERALVAAVDKFPVPSGKEYAKYLAGLLSELSSQVRKGVHAVFPSRALLQDVYYMLHEDLEREGIAVYAQGIDSTRMVFEALAEDDALAMSVFRTKPDVHDPVPACTVVCRIPFSPPNIVDDARRQKLSAMGMDGFREVNIGEALLMVREWAERMLVSEERSVLVMADPRVLPGKSRWGSQFMSAFSEYQKVTCPEKEVVPRVSGWLSGRYASSADK